jgi:hypothetical protein
MMGVSGNARTVRADTKKNTVENYVKLDKLKNNDIGRQKWKNTV